jgi:hypothetical protein
MRALGFALALALAVVPGCKRPTKAPLVCKRPVAITAEAGSVWWFGEMHGTEESPTFIGDVACSVAQAGYHVQVALEIWATEQTRIEKFLATGDRATLLAGPFWAQHDGRSSAAMVELLDRVRWLRRAGANIDVVAFDVTDKPDRDEAMAIKVLATRHDKGVVVGLSGNIHSRRTKWNATTPLVSHLVDAKLPIKTHDISAAGGTMWSCIATPDHEPVCGEHPMRVDTPPGTPWTFGPPRDDSHDGVYFVGPTKASVPAKPKS